MGQSRRFRDVRCTSGYRVTSDMPQPQGADLRAAGGGGASSPDAVARWLWNKIGKR
jgi:hypothetical protein